MAHLSNYSKKIIFLLAFIMLAGTTKSFSQEKGVKPQFKIGAYYYDGWNGKSKQSMTKALVDSFPEREPIWGWITSTPQVMQKQIDVAAQSGLSFFSFCWYHKNNPGTDSLNHALKLFIAAPNTQKLNFCLLVANHEGYEIGPKDWDKVCGEWVNLFKTSNYLTVNKKPLIIFYSIKTLLTNFGSTAEVKKAIKKLRETSVANGLPGVTIAGCVSGELDLMNAAQTCDFDFLTGYNYHHMALKKDQKIIPIDTLSAVSKRVWSSFKTNSKLPYIPVATLNWDPRPWAAPKNYYSTSPRFIGYSTSSVYQSVKDLTTWLSQNTENTSKEKIGLLYAWNEYGEGAWLTPSKNDLHLLKGVAKALKGN